MTLSNLFKAQAIFVWLYAAMFWVAPEFASQGPGWVLTPDSIAFGQIVAVPLFALGLFSWMAPSWVGDNLKKVGMIFGVYINLALVAVQRSGSVFFYMAVQSAPRTLYRFIHTLSAVF